MKIGNVNKIVFTVFVVAFMATAVHAAKFLKKHYFIAPETEKRIPLKAKGDSSAPIHIIEYSDFQCPACTRAAKTLKEYYEKYPSKMYVEFRHYPIEKLHPYAVTAAKVAECVAQQGKFWPYHDLLFETNRQWPRSMRVRGKLMDMAAETGAEPEALRACVEDPGLEIIIQEEKNEGKSRGVSATPTYFINDKMVVGSNSMEKELQDLFGKGDL